ncbi:acetyltransferase [uncultured Butyricimonas sp.]|uniref:acetyltransferase n=1 Tax=uncultured Butyricimonas sp. TaxID=1268785 RepID=UPI0026DD3C22|nr:acetyltransferase [uncultured Butyricimonas sp.]
MEKIIIVGAGQHCRVVLYNVKAQGVYQVACILDENETCWGSCIDGIVVEPYKNFDKDILDSLRKKYKTNKFFIGFGAMKFRKKVFEFFREQGWEAVNIIHPEAVVAATAQLGEGILIEAGCLVTPAPVIGNNVVVNTGSQINHDNIVEDHVYIASGVILSGGVRVNANTLLDDGVVVTLGCCVGANCIIGAGAVVTKDIPDNVVAYGSPCKVVRNNN